MYKVNRAERRDFSRNLNKEKQKRFGKGSRNLTLASKPRESLELDYIQRYDARLT